MFSRMKQKQGFTLLEIIIVIIIIGILASVAMPKLFENVERSRGSEAINNLSTLRQAMERCFYRQGGTYAGCTNAGANPTLDIDLASTNWTYSVQAAAQSTFTLRATRTTASGGVATRYIEINEAGAKAGSAAAGGEPGALQFYGLSNQ